MPSASAMTVVGEEEEDGNGGGSPPPTVYGSHFQGCLHHEVKETVDKLPKCIFTGYDSFAMHSLTFIISSHHIEGRCRPRCVRH